MDAVLARTLGPPSSAGLQNKCVIITALFRVTCEKINMVDVPLMCREHSCCDGAAALLLLSSTPDHWG